jgi:hypothetical protein
MVTGDPINKTQAWNQVRKIYGVISNRDFLKKVSDMLEMGYLKDVSKNKHEFLIQRVNETDSRTWLMIIESNEKFLKEAIEGLSKHKKLFPKLKSSHKYANLPLSKVFADFSKFSLSIDHLMITHIRAKYMQNFGMIRGSVAEDIIRQIDKIIKKGITKLYEDHPKEKKPIMFAIRKTNRRFDNLMI